LLSPTFTSLVDLTIPSVAGPFIVDLPLGLDKGCSLCLTGREPPIERLRDLTTESDKGEDISPRFAPYTPVSFAI
jgi:hypothetical protein